MAPRPRPLDALIIDRAFCSERKGSDAAASAFYRERMAEIIPLRHRELEPLWRQRSASGCAGSVTSAARRLADTADRAGVSPQYLSEIERGLKEPSSEMIAAVAGALEVTLVELTAAVADDLRGSRPRRARRRSGRSAHRLAGIAADDLSQEG